MTKNTKLTNALTSQADLYPTHSVNAPLAIGPVMDPKEKKAL